MEVQLTADQEAFVRKAIASGRLQREEDAVMEALSRWEERERSRVEVLAALDEAEADLENGRYADYGHDTLPQTCYRVKERSAGVAGSRPVVDGHRLTKHALGRSEHLAIHFRLQRRR